MTETRTSAKSKPLVSEAAPEPPVKTPRSEIFRQTSEKTDAQLRAAARGLMTEKGVSQAALADAMGISQSSVSHMLSDRSYGLTAAEVSFIELKCHTEDGTLYRSIGLVYERSLEQQIYEIPGITNQAAEVIVAAIQAVRADVLRQGRQP